MNVWSVKFSGIYPVGAVAVVCTYGPASMASPHEAEETLRRHLKGLYPNLDPEPVVASLLDVRPNAVHVLLNGDY